MKKMVLSAFACIMLAGTMNAANAEKEFFLKDKTLENTIVNVIDEMVAPCYMVFDYYHEDTGRFSKRETLTVEASSFNDCGEQMAAMVLRLSDANPGFDIIGSSAM